MSASISSGFCKHEKTDESTWPKPENTRRKKFSDMLLNLSLANQYLKGNYSRKH